MEAEQKTFTYKADDVASDHEKQTAQRYRFDFLVPFVIISSFTLPSLAVLALTRQTAGYDVLKDMGYYQLIQIALWVLIPLAALCGLLYMWRARHWGHRLVAASVLVVVVGFFVYILLG